MAARSANLLLDLCLAFDTMKGTPPPPSSKKRYYPRSLFSPNNCLLCALYHNIPLYKSVSYLVFQVIVSLSCIYRRRNTMLWYPHKFSRWMCLFSCLDAQVPGPLAFQCACPIIQMPENAEREVDQRRCCFYCVCFFMFGICNFCPLLFCWPPLPPPHFESEATHNFEEGNNTNSLLKKKIHNQPRKNYFLLLCNT